VGVASKAYITVIEKNERIRRMSRGDNGDAHFVRFNRLYINGTTNTAKATDDVRNPTTS